MAWSLPSRERGLKFELPCPVDNAIQVAPLAGAWIEIDEELLDPAVALSLPSRERGLKCIITFLRCSQRKSRSPRGSVD